MSAMEIPGQPVPSTPPPATTSSRDAWERIKQHKVVQWTLAYLALAYTLLHGAELLGNSLGWSHGLLRVFTLLLIMGVPVVINVDGEDWARKKWSGFAVKWLRASEAWACRLANVVIADAKVIQDRYLRIYHRETVLVQYGANIRLEDVGTDTLTKFGLEPRKYILFVGRMVPENRADLLIEAFRAVPRSAGIKAVIVGDAPYSEDFKKELVALSDDRVVFTGYAFGDAYRELSRHCLFYVLSSGVEGTRPVLLDQMGFGNCVVVRDSAANSAVVGDAGVKFENAREKESLAEQMNYLIAHPDVVEEYRGKAVTRVKAVFGWGEVTDKYEALFRELAGVA